MSKLFAPELQRSVAVAWNPTRDVRFRIGCRREVSLARVTQGFVDFGTIAAQTGSAVTAHHLGVGCENFLGSLCLLAGF